MNQISRVLARLDDLEAEVDKIPSTAGWLFAAFFLVVLILSFMAFFLTT